jgi:hypothetical protein
LPSTRIRRAILSAFTALLFAGGSAHAGGPLIVQDNGQPFTWATTSAVAYVTDNGPLSPSVNEAAARARVASMFAVWTAVPSANISYSRTGFIADVGAFTDGDVSTGAEFTAVEDDCFNTGSQSAIVYDANGTIFVDLGIDETSIIGFAGPCASDGTHFVSGRAALNGLFQDGQALPVADLTAAEFDAVFVHEFGHFSGLQHSQINVNCLAACGTDDSTGVPTMFPFLLNDGQLSLAVDDIAWISKLYPDPAGGTGFVATHGTITGTVFFSDGESHAQNVNVIARRVDNPGTAGVNESRTIVGSNVSGHRFRLVNANPINNADCFFCSDGSLDPADIGFYEISVPPGNYTVELESIDPAFVAGSGLDDGSFIEMPGTAPAALGPINVTAGATSSGNDMTLIGTDPRFDQFEGPGP